MSILLDALRKSEAQRRLGEIPTLQTNVSADDGRSADSQHWIPLALILLSAAIISWTGMTQFRGAESVAVAPEGSEASTAVVAEQLAPAAIPDDAGVAGRNGSPIQTRSRATTPVKDYVDDNPDAREGEGAGTPSRRVAHVEVEKAPAADAREIQAPAKGSAGIATVPAKPRAEPELAEPDSYSPQAINYWQMPQSMREEMGEFRISVMVFAEEPADRFLLLNGSRLREQQETDGGVRLEEIQRDRAVFSYRKYRFHVTN